MKVLYVATNARCYAEDVAAGCRLVEEPDGIHPIQPDNIWRNNSRVVHSWGPDDSICIIFQGVVSPETYGPGITKTFLDQQVIDDLLLKFHQMKQPISRVWWRRLVNNVTTGLMLFLAGGIISSMATLAYATFRVVTS